MNIMGMSSEMSPGYLTVTPSGQVTYILDSSTIELAQLQLAVPSSEVLLIQEEGKTIDLSDSPVLVADVNAENLNVFGNNVIVLMSPAQEVMIVNSDITGESNTIQQWEEEEELSLTPAPTVLAESIAQFISNNLTENELSETEVREAATPNATVDDARCWFRDSLITTAALSSLTTFIQSRSTSKDS